MPKMTSYTAKAHTTAVVSRRVATRGHTCVGALPLTRRQAHATERLRRKHAISPPNTRQCTHTAQTRHSGGGGGRVSRGAHTLMGAR